MKYQVIDHDKVIAQFAEIGMAHSFAEIWSYEQNRNAIYGLFKIRVQEI